MNRLLLPLMAFLCLQGCASTSIFDDHGGELPTKAVDGTSSPITDDQALAIARGEVTKREDWPDHKLGADGLLHTVVYLSRRINNGGWRVVAQRAVVEDRPEGAIAYEPIPGAIIIINKRGVVSGYMRQSTNE